MHTNTPPQVWVHHFIMLSQSGSHLLLVSSLLLSAQLTDGGLSTSRLEQPHLQARHHILTLYRAPPERKPLAACTVIAAFCATDRQPRSYPLSNGALTPLLGQWGELERLSTSKLEQAHLQEWHITHICTPTDKDKVIFMKPLY